MKQRLTFICIAMSLLPIFCVAEGLQLTSVNPATSYPGQSVQLFGAGFTPATRVVLGAEELTPVLLNAGQLQLLIPPLSEGEYALQLTTPGKSSAQSLRLHIELPPPSIDALSPSDIDECSTATERLVTISGQNFQPGLHLLLDGAAMPANLQNAQQLSFTAPPLTAGIYGLEIVNPNGKRSLPHSLHFNNIPQIYGLSEGDNYVNHYQLIISGRNFYPHSTLVVSESQIGFIDLPPLQRIISGRNARRDGTSGPHSPAGDYLNHVDCNTLIYYRFPYSGQAKQMSLQIINRDGRTSGIEQTSMP